MFTIEYFSYLGIFRLRRFGSLRVRAVTEDELKNGGVSDETIDEAKRSEFPVLINN
jgi:hypothetical protein